MSRHLATTGQKQSFASPRQRSTTARSPFVVPLVLPNSAHLSRVVAKQLDGKKSKQTNRSIKFRVCATLRARHTSASEGTCRLESKNFDSPAIAHTLGRRNIGSASALSNHSTASHSKITSSSE